MDSLLLSVSTQMTFYSVNLKSASRLELTICFYLLVDLLDRGWRRSGCYLYKPEMDKTCCPQYTIRLKASDFVPSKEQQRVSKRMQRYPQGAPEGTDVIFITYMQSFMLNNV